MVRAYQRFPAVYLHHGNAHTPETNHEEAAMRLRADFKVFDDACAWSAFAGNDTNARAWLIWFGDDAMRVSHHRCDATNWCLSLIPDYGVIDGIKLRCDIARQLRRLAKAKVGGKT
jgi:hypothetical protein